ncbi:MAG: SH3 domain-containing protein [Desulfobulbaceae bacterium]|uniref:SH3 domain-containing protein n=1 Tax=Candidatus Desulfobia pelagia TaxID=2841692 RepID=A0A8J6TDY2_9BACT|nr:SH3 domain-containing protein [Candidatus Desulfobia pelagia]
MEFFMKRFGLAVLFLLFFTSIANAKMVSIAADLVNMRSGPGEKYSVVWELGKGYPLKVLETKGDWVKVIDYEQDTGWIFKSLVNRSPHLIVKKKIVNIRSGPGTGYKIVRKAQNGVVFQTLERKSGWVKVKHEEENVVGWVMRSLLWGW